MKEIGIMGKSYRRFIWLPIYFIVKQVKRFSDYFELLLNKKK